METISTNSIVDIISCSNFRGPRSVLQPFFARLRDWRGGVERGGGQTRENALA